MTAAHFTGAGFGAVAGGVLSECLSHFLGYGIDPAVATAIAAALIAAGGLLAHGIERYGLRGLGVRFWRGSSPLASGKGSTASAAGSPPSGPTV